MSKRLHWVPEFGSLAAVVFLAWLGCSSPTPDGSSMDDMTSTGPSMNPGAAPGANAPAPGMTMPAADEAQANPGQNEGETPSMLDAPANDGDEVEPTPPASDPSDPAATDPATTDPAATDPAATDPTPPVEPEPTPPAFPVGVGKPTIYLAGDSTVQTYGAAQAPQQGWGQRIQEFFSDDVVFVNKAIGGRSSKSYIDEGRLDEIVGLIQQGDYLFAQWGINDRYRSDPTRFTDPSTTFKQYLSMYIEAARSKNAIPVLVTPTPRLDFSNGAFQNGFVEYCAAIKELGAETDTRVIDLQTKGLAYYTSLGLDAVVATVILPPMDVLHFRDTGAFQMARLVSEGVRESDLPIAQFVR